jgi:hypothetical protein
MDYRSIPAVINVYAGLRTYPVFVFIPPDESPNVNAGSLLIKCDDLLVFLRFRIENFQSLALGAYQETAIIDRIYFFNRSRKGI